MAVQGLPDGFHTKPLNDGKVEFRIVGGGKEIAAALLTGEQLSVVVGNLLNAAHAAFHNADKQLSTSPNLYQREPTQVERWAIGGTNRQNQQVLIIEVGEATIAFAVPPDKVRELARYLIIASHHPQSLVKSGVDAAMGPGRQKDQGTLRPQAVKQEARRQLQPGLGNIGSTEDSARSPHGSDGGLAAKGASPPQHRLHPHRRYVRGTRRSIGGRASRQSHPQLQPRSGRYRRDHRQKPVRDRGARLH